MPTRTLTATVASNDDARRAVEALSLHGVDGRRIHVSDPGRTGAPTSRAADRSTDARVARRLGSRAVRGLAVGVLVGAVLGALVLGVIGGGTTSLLLGALGGAFAGAGIGVLAGLQSTPTMAPAWEDANAVGPGVRRLVVDEVTDDEVDALRTLLERHARVVWTDA
jgi:hypothetical protein